MTKADAGSRDGSHGRTSRYSAARAIRHGCTRRPVVFAARIPQGPDARNRRGIPARSASGHKGAAPFGKVEVLTDEVGGVFDGLNKQEKQKVATRSAKRTCTPAAWRSEVSRTATRQVCGSGHARNVPWGTPGNNTRRAAAHNSSGRRTPPQRAVSRAASPFPPMDSISGGSQGWGVRGGRA